MSNQLGNYSLYISLIASFYIIFESYNLIRAKSIDLDGSLIVECNGQDLNLYSDEVHIEKH